MAHTAIGSRESSAEAYSRYDFQGQFRGAIRHLIRAEEGSRRVRGADHERTLRLRLSLARTHIAAGDIERGTAGCEQPLADCVEALGETHTN